MNNNGFFTPTILIISVLFLSILIFMFLESAMYSTTLNSYETLIFYEEVTLKGEKFIKKNNINKICSNNKLIINKGIKSEITISCLKKRVDEKYNKNLEINTEEYIKLKNIIKNNETNNIEEAKYIYMMVDFKEDNILLQGNIYIYNIDKEKIFAYHT